MLRNKELLAKGAAIELQINAQGNNLTPLRICFCEGGRQGVLNSNKSVNFTIRASAR